jgi:hypothetical protein
MKNAVDKVLWEPNEISQGSYSGDISGLRVNLDKCIFVKISRKTWTILLMLYAFFWVVPRRLNFICRRFELLYLFQLHRPTHTYLPMKMEQTNCSETSACKIQTPGNYPEESIQHSEKGESLKSRRLLMK